MYWILTAHEKVQHIFFTSKKTLYEIPFQAPAWSSTCIRWWCKVTWALPACIEVLPESFWYQITLLLNCTLCFCWLTQGHVLANTWETPENSFSIFDGCVFTQAWRLQCFFTMAWQRCSFVHNFMSIVLRFFAEICKVFDSPMKGCLISNEKTRLFFKPWF